MSEALRTRAATPANSAGSSGPIASGLLQRKCACGGAAGAREGCESCGGAKLWRFAAGSAEPHRAPPIVHEVLSSPGRPLDPDTRALMESRLGHDFGKVRVHTDLRAAASARAVNALAYTVGHHLVFGAARYNPHAEEGQRLLAHELVHVGQQAGTVIAAPAADLAVSDPADPAERAAETVAERAMAGSRARAPLSTIKGGTLARMPVRKPDLFAPVHFGRGAFDNRFDAEVDPRTHTVTLIMSVDFTPAGWAPSQNPMEAIAAFKPRMKQAVEQTWSGRYGLQSVCEGPPDKFHARVRLETDGRNPHATIYLHPDTPGGRSAAGDGQSALQESDVYAQEHSRYFQTRRGQPPEKRGFMQIPSAHEFGHLMGLSHPHCAGNADQCYGVTTQEAMDVMGLGSYVSPRDYAPFQNIMEVFGQNRLAPMCNKWRLVDPD